MDVRSFLTERVKKKSFTSAAVIAGNRRRTIVEEYVGADAGTFFDLQSITKSVVTSPLIHALDISPTEGVHEGATVRELLLHTGGFRDKDLDIRIKNPYEAWKKIFASKPRRKPGTEIEYADLNYRLLGRYLELKYRCSLQDLAREVLWGPLGISELTYIPFDTLNTAGVPRSRGRIDDDGVFEIGSVVGDDGVFGTARALVSFLKAIDREEGPLAGYADFLDDLAIAPGPAEDFYEALRYGSKCPGWEVNFFPTAYAGPVSSAKTLEKSGGAGTFIWLDLLAGNYFVYLTNHGKPEPFKRRDWNKLVEELAPDILSEIVFGEN